MNGYPEPRPSARDSLAGQAGASVPGYPTRLIDLLKLAAFSLAKAREITEAPGYTGPLANTIKYAEGLTRYALGKLRESRPPP